jgi:sugar phosphate isomerase/epimerase
MTAVAMLATSGCCSTGPSRSADEPRISVFASFVRGVAKQRNVSLEEAADMLYALGVRGFDIGPREKDLSMLAATKLKPINFYFFAKFLDADGGAAHSKDCLDTAVKYSVPRIMVVPPNFTKDGDERAEFAKILAGMKKFTADAKALGITVTVEDFGGTRNCCSHIKYLKSFLDEIPDVRLALDSGNLYYAGRGEDILELMDYAKDRIAHVHLKDQTVENNRKYATLGLGAVPNEKIVKTVAAAKYDGWYTLENPVGDTYNDTVRQVALVKNWIAEGEKVCRR